MTTYYRPTERRGKRVIYRSADPAEPKYEVRAGLAVLLAFGLVIALGYLLSIK